MGPGRGKNIKAELLDIVDLQNRVVRVATREEACQIGWLHRAVNILVFNAERQIFLQQRASSKKAFPLYWDLSVAEHVRSGESFTEAAKRGLQEELGILTEVELIRPVHMQNSRYVKDGEWVIENELVELYRVDYDWEIKLNREEVNVGGFFSIEQIQKMVESKSHKFTPWFLDEWEFLGKERRKKYG